MTEKATDIEVGPNYTWSSLLTLARITPSNNASFLRTALEGLLYKAGHKKHDTQLVIAGRNALQWGNFSLVKVAYMPFFQPKGKLRC